MHPTPYTDPPTTHRNTPHTMASFKQMVDYLFGKRSEIKDMSAKDAMLAKVVADIHRKRTDKRFITVPLFHLHPVHGLDRENAVASLNKRIAALQERKEEILNIRTLDRDALNEFLPSVSAIKVVRESDTSYIAYEGNGRLGALHAVFTPEDNIQLEVEEYQFNNPTKILRRMNRVRKMNGLLK